MRALDANIPFLFYFLALVGFSAGYMANRDILRKSGAVLLWAGFLAQLVLLAARWVEAGRAPMSNMYESLLVMASGLVLCWILIGRSESFKGLGGWVAAGACFIIALANLKDPSVRPLMPALRSNWLFYHVSVTMLGYGAFLLSTVAALALLAKARKDPSYEKGAGRAMSEFLFRANSLGFLLLTGGIILGSVWANEAWGSYWSWDPKETWSLITWFFYAVLIHLWRTKGWRGRRFAWATVAGFAFVMFTYYGVNYLLSGLHSYAG